jgi:lysophospholipase L1-like esterase
VNSSWLRHAVVAVALATAGCGTVAGAAVNPATVPRASPTSPSATASRLNVVGLGDSVTSGMNCDCDDYVTGFGRLLTKDTGARVSVTDDGKAGAKSSDLADELEGEDSDDRSRQSDVADADVVVITMGANDLTPALAAWRSGSCSASCYGPEVEQMETDLSRVLDRVHDLDHGHARVLVTTYWNVFTDGQVARKAERQGYLAWSDAVTRTANAAITRVAATHDATLVDLYTPFKGDGGTDPTSLLADDGDHPDPAGTAAISRAVLAAYESSH